MLGGALPWEGSSQTLQYRGMESGRLVVHTRALVPTALNHALHTRTGIYRPTMYVYSHGVSHRSRL